MASRKKINLGTLSVQELQHLQEDLQHHLHELDNVMRVREEVIKKVLKCSEVKSICKQHSFNIVHLFNPPGKDLPENKASAAKGKKAATKAKAVAASAPRAKKRIVLPKYRLPTGETWSGRGLMPKVFTRYMDRGGKLEDVAIR